MEIPWCAVPGEGMPVLVLGGLGWRASGSVISGYAGPGLAQVAFDYPRRWPRHRLDSMAALAGMYRDAMDGLGLAAVRLLGISLGGMVALRLALDWPARVESLALVSTAAAAARVTGRWRLPLSRVVTGSLPAEAFYRFYRRWGPLLVGTGLFGPGRDAARLWADPMGRRKMRDLLRAMARFDERPRLRDVRPATLVVHGRSDAVIGPDAAVELARGIPRARLAVLDGADHFAFLTHRDRVLKELRYFWTSTGKS